MIGSVARDQGSTRREKCLRSIETLWKKYISGLLGTYSTGNLSGERWSNDKDREPCLAMLQLFLLMKEISQECTCWVKKSSSVLFPGTGCVLFSIRFVNCPYDREGYFWDRFGPFIGMYALVTYYAIIFFLFSYACQLERLI